jgi:ribosomal protein S18 acetylase RimI-like enzyme
MDYQIRPYQPSDQAELVSCIREFIAFTISLNPDRKKQVADEFYQEVIDRFAQMIHSGNGNVYVAELEGQMAGFVYGFIKMQSLEEKEEFLSVNMGQIEYLYVRPDYQNQGIGKLLLNTITEFFRSKKCSMVSLIVLDNNVNAINYYAKLGFTTKALEMTKNI